MTTPRHTTFAIVRDLDITGISGTGHVADGVYWPDGSASVRWRGEHPSIVHWTSAESVEAIHGHGGATRIVNDIPRVTPPDLDAVQQRVQTCLQAEIECWAAQEAIEVLWLSVQDIQPLLAEIARLRESTR